MPAEKSNGEELLRVAISFTVSWQFWQSLAILISWFGIDDLLKLSVHFVATCLFV
jgi:hypothetical protein